MWKAPERHEFSKFFTNKAVMDYTCLNSSNISASFANDLQLVEELYFRTRDREISDNDENESSDSDREEESDENCSQAEFSQHADMI